MSHICTHQAKAQGQEDNGAGVLRKHNPYHTDAALRQAWFDGWDSFARIAA